MGFCAEIQLVPDGFILRRSKKATTGVAGSQQYHAYDGRRSTTSVPTEWQDTGQYTTTARLVYLHARTGHRKRPAAPAGSRGYRH